MGYHPVFSFLSHCWVVAGSTSFSVFLTNSISGTSYSLFTTIMASFHPDLEMVTVRGVTLLIDPSSLVDGWTYLLIGRDTVEPVDSVPTSTAALLLNPGRGDLSQEQRRSHSQMGRLVFGIMSHSQFAQDASLMTVSVPFSYML